MQDTKRYHERQLQLVQDDIKHLKAMGKTKGLNALRKQEIDLLIRLANWSTLDDVNELKNM